MTEGNARGASSMISLFRLVIYKIMLENPHIDFVKTGFYNNCVVYVIIISLIQLKCNYHEFPILRKNGGIFIII